MLQLLYTDLIKNPWVKLLILLLLFAEITLVKSIKHSLIIIGIPYLISMGLSYKFKTKKVKKIKWISYQYRPEKIIAK